MTREEMIAQNVAQFMIGIADLEPRLSNTELIDVIGDQVAVMLTQVCRTITTVDTDGVEFARIAEAAASVMLARFGWVFPRCVGYTLQGGTSLFVDLETDQALSFVEDLLKENDHGMAL